MKTGNKTVLIVEDDECIREIYTATLEIEGYTVVNATHGKEALDFLLSVTHSEYPDCILLDLMMPVMDGNTFLENLSRQNSLLSRIPVFVCTGFGKLTYKSQVAEVLEKPIAMDYLIDVLKQSFTSLQSA